MTTKTILSKQLVLAYDTEANLRMSHISQTASNTDLLNFALAINSLQRQPAHAAFTDIRSVLTHTQA